MPDPLAFDHQRSLIRDGVELAYIREGIGGVPLLLVHGWPETKRIWWRNIAPLAAAGFEVIAPDLRGFGDSGLAEDGCYDLAAHARDLHSLVYDLLGHRHCVAAAGDLGGAVIIDLGLRHPRLVRRQVIFNSPLPTLHEAYRRAGIARRPPARTRMASDYFYRQGREADALIRELSTPERRRRYVAEFYGHRFWSSPGSFDRADVDFMTEPFEDAQHLRASFANYESALGTRAVSEPPRFSEPSTVPTLVLFGPDDHVIWPDFPERCKAAFTDLTGPFIIPNAGHFLQWERAESFNTAATAFLMPDAVR